MNYKNVILGLLVLVIWGGIGYKIYHALADDGADRPMTEKRKPQPEIFEHYELKLNYPDPFLKKKKIERKMVKAAPANVQKEIIDWTRLKYLGMLHNVPRKSSVANLTIDNSEIMMREGQEVKGFRLVRILTDSVYVRYGKQYTYIKRYIPHE